VSVNRRRFLNGAGAIVGCTLGRFGVAEADAARSGRTPITRKEWDAIIRNAGKATLTCVRTSQVVEGPFYYESSPERRAIAEKHAGEPLRLGITLAGLVPEAGSGGCMPLAGAVIDVWHTDASGLYSNVGTDLQLVDTVGQTFLRGHQITDDNGYAEFDTIVPGWEIVAAAAPVIAALRTTHIHVKAFHGREVLTAQLYLPDDLIDGLYATSEPYKSHRLLTAPGLTRSYERIRNKNDKFYSASNAKPMTVTREKGVLVAKAVLGIESQGNRGFKNFFR
jgi:protocatechuate 3,4-dioxygenase beta subunit